MLKYNLSNIKYKILQLENPNNEVYRHYMSTVIDKTITTPFPEWFSVTTIYSSAFSYCTNLTSVTIPDSVTIIVGSTFNYCTNLTDIYLHPSTPPTLGILTIPSTTTIHVPVGSGDAYKSATNWSSFADKIVEDIEI